MSTMNDLRADFARETSTARVHLSRVPEAQFDWRPHAKSSTVGMLASHIVDCVRWTGSIFGASELDVDPKQFKSFAASTSGELLAAFDAAVADGARLLESASDADAHAPWRFLIMGRLRWEKPRATAFKDFTLHHLIHHRGQLSVYLRLLDVPVPGSYGPTADDR